MKTETVPFTPGVKEPRPTRQQVAEAITSGVRAAAHWLRNRPACWGKANLDGGGCDGGRFPAYCKECRRLSASAPQPPMTVSDHVAPSQEGQA